MAKRQGVTYRDTKKKKKKQEPKREEPKARKSERAGGASKSGARNQGRNAVKSAKTSIRDAYKRNTESAQRQKQSGKTVGSHYGQISNRTTDTQKNRDQARKDLASGFHARTVGAKDKNGNTKVTDYVKQQHGTGKGKSASAYNKYKTAKTNREEEGKVTVHTKSPITIATQTAMEGVRNVTSNVSQANKWYDKEEKKAQKEGMTYGDKKEFIRKWVADPSNAEYLKNYKKALKEDSTYSYTKAPTDSNEFFQDVVASQPAFSYQKVKTETDIPVYQTDKEGNVKYDKDGKPVPKRNKEGDIVYQKADTTIGNNILNARAGGFDKNGRLTSMEGSEKMGSQTAGALRDAKFFGGMLQGSSYGDITRGLGTYSNAAATDLDRTTQSGAFNAGYGVGIMAQFGLSGINGMAKSLLSEGLKSVPKTLAKNAGLSAALDTPLNVADAVKMGTDSRGNVNMASVGMFFGINSLMSGLMPAGIEGIGAGITHAQSKELLGILAREEGLVKAGKALSPQDALRRDELLQKQAKTAEGQVSAAGIIAGKTFDEITGKGGNATVNAIRAKVMVNPKQALTKIPTDGSATTDDLISIGAVKEIARKRGDYQTAAEAELKLRDIKDGLDPEMKRQVDEMMKQVDSTRKIENANIVREADAEDIVAKAADKDKKVTGRVLEELEGAVEYAKQTGNKQLEASAREALDNARIENKKYIDGINKRYQQLGDKLNIPIKAGTKRELDDVLRANNVRIPEKEYGGFVLRDPKTKKVREIYVNADSPDSVAFAVGHEVSHVMEAAGEDYRIFRDLLKGYDNGRIWDEEASKVVDLYAGVKGADYDRETTANVLGRILTSDGEAFLDNVFKEDRTLFEKLYDFIRKLLHGSKEQSEDLTKIETKMREILDNNGGHELRDEEFGDGVASFMMKDGVTEQGFYSKARVAVEKLGKDAKVRENDFIRYLKKTKNGVSDEEIKWLGIRTAFEENGGNPMTKQELLDWIDANRLVLEEKKRTTPKEGEYFPSGGQTIARWGDYRLDGGENYREYEYILPDSDYTNSAMDTHWYGDAGVVLHTRAQDFTTGEVASSAEVAASVSAQEAKRMANDAIDGMYDTIDTMELALNGNGYDMHEFYADGQRLDGLYATIQRLGSEDGGGDYVVRVFNDQNGTTYEKIVSESAYKSAQNGDDVFGISPFVEEYLQNSKPKTSTGRKGEKRVLFVDEIQSDWHNKGAQAGYRKIEPSIEEAEQEINNYISMLKKRSESEIGSYDGKYFIKSDNDSSWWAKPRNNSTFGVYKYNPKTDNWYDQGIVGRAGTIDAWGEPLNKDAIEFLEFDKYMPHVKGFDKGVPDAPYRNNYTDYAMKRMLLEATQNDQEYIAWTTAKQQARRWSSAYMKGYEIEYDQEIPSFMSRYCKQWGADVEKITLAENGEEVWAVRINDAMRKSVLEEGQADFMMINDSANVAAGISGIRKTNPSTGKITEETIKTTERGSADAQKKLETLLGAAKRTGKTSREDIIKIHDKVRRETGWFVGADGTWQFEINDAPARFNVKLTPRKHGFTDADRSKLANIEQQLRDNKLSRKDRDALIEQKRNLDHAWGTKGLYSTEGANLKDILHHPELFKAYKKLEHFKVRMEDMGDVKIYRDSKGNIDGVSSSGAYGERSLKGISLNRDIRAVPKGETLADYATALRQTAAEYGISLPSPKDFKGLTKEELLALVDDKGIKIKGKVKRGEKSVTLNRKNATEDDLIKLLSVEDKDVPQEFLMGTLLHEVQHKIQVESKMSGGGMPDVWEETKQIFDNKGNVLHTYKIRDFTIARNPKDQAKLMKAKAERVNAKSKYEELASKTGATLDSNDLEFLELSILKAFPKQAEKAIRGNNVNAYVSLMMNEVEDMAKLDKGLLPFNAKFPESPMLNISMVNYFTKSFEAYRLAEHPHNIYSDLIGEQQSRMIQHRRRLTPRERTEEFPLDTEATYRFVDLPEMRGLSKLPKPKNAQERIVQDTFEKKYPHSQVNEEGKLKYEADFSILDEDEKVIAEREARAKEQAETVKKVRKAVAEEAKKASAYGKDKEVYPLREQAIIKAFNDAYDERTGTVKWGEVYKALKDDPNFNANGANAIRNRIKAVFNEQTVTVTKSEASTVEKSTAKTTAKSTSKKKAETVKSKEDFRSEFEGEARVAENEMSDEEFFRGLEAPSEEPVVEANWNEAVPVPKDTKAINEVKGLYEQLDAAAQKLKTATTAEKRMAIEKERTGINEQIETLANGNEAVREYSNLYKALDNASTEEERTAIREELARMENGGAKMSQIKEEAPQPPKPKQAKPKKQKQAKPKQEKPKQGSPAKPKKAKQSQKSEIKPQEQRVAETLERQKSILEQEEKALAKAKTPEEKRLAQRRLGLAKGRVRKYQNALDALEKEKPPKAEAEITPLPKGESMPEPPSGESAELKEKMPSLEQIVDNAKKGYISTHEIGEHAKRLKEDWSNEVEVTKKAFREAVKKGELGSKVGRDISYDEAFKKASADIEKDWGKVYDRVMSRDPYVVETTQSAADKDALFQYLVMKAGTSEGKEADKFAMLHLKVMDKMDEAASLGGHMLQLQSYILRNSPEGRVRWVAREIARLTKEYEKHLKGKKIEISAAQIRAILEAKSAKEIADVMEETGKMIWKQIPAGFFEASNQIRHFAMLFNPKTHARNVFGNTVFLGARALSDITEVGMTKAFGWRLKQLSQIDQYESLIKDLEKQAKDAQPKEKQAIKGRIREMEKLLEEAKADSNSPMKQFLANGEVSGCKKLLNERFEADYATNGGQNVGKWKEGRRSAGYVYEQSGNKVKDTLAKGMNKLIDLNYNLLDREDRWYFRPAYERAYVRWCKSRGIVEEVGGRKIVTPKALEKMSETEMQEATAYAMQQAKVATFRDDSAISDRIIAWKQATEGKKGTGLGTVGYRTLNVGLESVLPFVKTPVNIMRRGMDYSPIGMFRGLADSILAKDSQTFMRGIHEMSTGLTGTGICVLGMWAASHDWVTVHTGEVSGDEYYDRDMGYQDFSVNILGHSVSFDWMAPVQFSFFQGAALYKEWCEDKGVSMEMVLKGLEAGAMPMLEMSFMSSAKDTVTSFMERAYRDGTGSEANAAQAIGRTLFGTLPQDWLSGFVPQLSSQFAGYFDEKQRDTSSTLEDEWQRSWESFGRKMLNRLPYFRESLMPKVDRTGRDIETDIHYFDDKDWNPKLEEGMNVLAKFAMSFAMPPNIKKITLDKYDQAVIDPLGSDEIDAKTKEYVGLDLTGNPSYDRGEDLSRMTYKERYDYLRTKRQDQWDKWKKAVDSKSFNDMTDQMKLDELKDYHFISTVTADRTVYNDEYAKNKILEKGTESGKSKDEFTPERELWKNMKHLGGNAKDFVDAYTAVETVCARAHNSDYHTQALAIQAMDKSEKKKDITAKAYKIYGDKLDPANTFLSKYKSAEKALADYTNAYCSGESICEKEGVSDSKKNLSLAFANVEGGVPEKVYRAGGYDWNSAQAGGGLKKYGYTYESLAQMDSDAVVRFDADNNNRLNKEELVTYIESLGIDSQDEKACIFEYFKPSANSRNPYGTIADHLEWGTTPDAESGGGRRGRGRRGGHGGGSGGGSGMSWEAWLKKQGLSQSSRAGGSSRRVGNNTSDSLLNEAYRKKLTKNIRATSKKQ